MLALRVLDHRRAGGWGGNVGKICTEPLVLAS